MPTKKQLYYNLLVAIVSGVATILFGIICYFFLEIKQVIPFIFWGYSFATFLNLALFYVHKNLDISFFTTAILIFSGCYTIALFSGGISSPMLYIIPSIIIAGYIMRRKYGRWTTLFVSVSIIAMYLLESCLDCIKNYVPDDSQASFSLISISIAVVMLGGILGDFMAKSSYQVYRAKKQIETQNKEKEVLLKEIHHRVKNNLQIVMSLLKLQGYTIKDKETLEIFEETIGRIHSMALTHEMLYKGDDIANVGYDRYIDSLVANLIETLSIEKEKVEMHIDIPNIKLNIDTAIPLGLMINEIVTNILKYGADKNNEIHIDIKLNVLGRADFILEIGDRGVGIPKELNADASDSLGLQLIETLTDQLDGKMTRTSDNGTKYILEFKSQ